MYTVGTEKWWTTNGDTVILSDKYVLNGSLITGCSFTGYKGISGPMSYSSDKELRMRLEGTNKTILNGYCMDDADSNTYYFEMSDMKLSENDTYVTFKRKQRLGNGDLHERKYRSTVLWNYRPAKGSQTGQKKYSYEENIYENDKQYGEEWLVKVEPE